MMLSLWRRSVQCRPPRLARAFSAVPDVAAALPITTAQPVKSEADVLIARIVQDALPLRHYNELAARTRDVEDTKMLRCVAIGVVREMQEKGRLFDAQRFFIGCRLLTYDDIGAYFFHGRVTLETFSAAFKVARAKGGNPQAIHPQLHFKVTWSVVHSVTQLTPKTRPLLHHLLMALENDGFPYSDNLVMLQQLCALLSTFHQQTDWAEEATRIANAALRVVEKMPPVPMSREALSIALQLQWPLPVQTATNLERLRQLNYVVPALARVVRNVPSFPGGSRSVLRDAAVAAGLAPTSVAVLEALYDLKLATLQTSQQAYLTTSTAITTALEAGDVVLFELPGFARHVMLVMHRAESDPDLLLLRSELRLLQMLQQHVPSETPMPLLAQFIRSRLATLQRRAAGIHAAPACASSAAGATSGGVDLEYHMLFRSECDNGRYLTEAQSMEIFAKEGLWDASTKRFARVMTPAQVIIKMRCSIAQLSSVPQRQWEQSLVTHFANSDLHALIATYINGRESERPAMARVSDLLHKSMVRLCEKYPDAELAEKLRVFLASRSAAQCHPADYAMLVLLYPTCLEVVERCLDDASVFRHATFDELAANVIRKFASEHDFVPLSFFMATKLPPPGVRAFMLYNTSVNGCSSVRELWRVANLWTDLRLFRDPDQVSHKYTQMHARAANRVMMERMLAHETTPQSSDAEKADAIKRIEASFKKMQQGQRQLDKSAIVFAANQWCAEVPFAGETLWVANRARLESIVQQWETVFNSRRASSRD